MRKARQDGQIPKSQEIVAWGSMLATVFLVQVTVKLAGEQFRPLLARSAKVMADAETGPALSLFGSYLIGAAIMFIGGLIEIAFGVNAEGKSLETIAKPLTAVDK